VADTDYYALLGVGHQATDEEIKRAYRKMARVLHPDRTGGDAGAEERFKEVSRAYEVLKDRERRARYDRFGQEGADAEDQVPDFGASGLGDMFDAFFGAAAQTGGVPVRPVRGPDTEVVLQLSFTEAAFGGRKEITVRQAFACASCDATGTAAAGAQVPCPDCGGTGQQNRAAPEPGGQPTVVDCATCLGTAVTVSSPCPQCSGEGRRPDARTFAVEIPAGVDHGSTLRLTGRGPVGPRGGPPGDLYVRIAVAPDAQFVRNGSDVVSRLHVTMTQAALGSAVDAPTLEGTEKVALPAGTQTGQVLRLKGRGVPQLQTKVRGDLLYQVVVDVPTELTSEQEKLLHKLATARGEPVHPVADGTEAVVESAAT
jgi:molecular chaperone DnaJ